MDMDFHCPRFIPNRTLPLTCEYKSPTRASRGVPVVRTRYIQKFVDTRPSRPYVLVEHPLPDSGSRFWFQI